MVVLSLFSDSLFAAMFICLLLLFVYDCFSIFAEKVLCLSASEKTF